MEQDGVLNSILGLDYSWLSSISLVMWLIIMVNTWQWIGYNLVIYYAGLQSMNIELLEASDIDGANWAQKIFSIVIPLLWPTTILNMILNLIGGFRAFDIVYVLTRGGPAHYSEVLASYLYYYSFSAGGPNKMGVGASVAFQGVESGHAGNGVSGTMFALLDTTMSAMNNEVEEIHNVSVEHGNMIEAGANYMKFTFAKLVMICGAKMKRHNYFHDN